MNNGKKLCELLKRVRKQIADKYELNYEPGKCNNRGNCIGTCPQCDAELEDLQNQLEAKGIYDVALDKIISREIEQFTDKQISKRKKWFKFNPFTLEGMPLLSPELEEMNKENVAKEVHENYPVPTTLEGDVMEVPTKDIKKP